MSAKYIRYIMGENNDMAMFLGNIIGIILPHIHGFAIYLLNWPFSLLWSQFGLWEASCFLYRGFFQDLVTFYSDLVDCLGYQSVLAIS